MLKLKQLSLACQTLGVMTLAVGLTAGLSSCNEQDFYPVNQRPNGRAIPNELSRPTVDIMWVIDFSGSMSQHRANVAKNSPVINDVLEDLGVDFTMLVTKNTDPNGGFEGYLNDSGVLTPEVPNWKQKFGDAVGSNESGHPVESFTNSVYDYMSNHEDFKRKFYRGGYFMLIVVSDTDDRSSLHKNEETAAKILDLYSPNQTVYYGILCSDNKNCDSEWNRRRLEDNALIQLGSFFEIFRFFPVSEQSYRSHFEEIRNFLTTLRPVFYLKEMPRLESIRVTVDGIRIPSDPHMGWTFEPSTLGIYFNGRSAPKNGQKVYVDYQPVRHFEP